MIDTIQLPAEYFKGERAELHLEFQKQFNSKPKPTIPYVYGIMEIKKADDFNGSARLVTQQKI